MKDLGNLLIKWYRKNHRSLPWRETKDIYKVWLSEVILQQTRVEQGLPYYLRFLENFPDVHALAKAPMHKVLKVWEGLGYYSRARNLHAAAQEVSLINGGKFPDDYEGLLRLKGIGPYTAAAISSFCFEEARPVMDGNVFRFITRMLAIKKPVETPAVKKQIGESLRDLMHFQRPSEFNQAIMEFGALYCTPRSPDCPGCIMLAHCTAGSRGEAEKFPVKKKKAQVQHRYLTYFMLEARGKILVRQRGKGDIWEGLYEFPLLESPAGLEAGSTLQKFLRTRGIAKNLIHLPSSPAFYKHQLSHQTLNARVFRIQVKGTVKKQEGEKWVSRDDLSNYPFPRLLTRYLSQH